MFISRIIPPLAFGMKLQDISFLNNLSKSNNVFIMREGKLKFIDFMK